MFYKSSLNAKTQCVESQMFIVLSVDIASSLHATRCSFHGSYVTPSPPIFLHHWEIVERQNYKMLLPSTVNAGTSFEPGI